MWSCRSRFLNKSSAFISAAGCIAGQVKGGCLAMRRWNSTAQHAAEGAMFSGEKGPRP